MSQTLWGILFMTPYNIITVYAMTRMTPVPHPWRFFWAWQGIGALLYFIPNDLAGLVWLRPVLTSASWLLVTLFFSREKTVKTAFGALLISLLSVVGEVAAGFLGVALFGENANPEMIVNSPFHLFILQILFWLLMSLLCAALVLLWEKTVHPAEGSLLWRFVLIPISQYVLVILSGIVATFRSRGLEVYLPLIVVSLLCVAADLLLFRAIRAIGAQQRAAARAAALQSRLEAEISRASERVARLEETARLRHDLRNHLQTVEALMERGETALAEKQLDQLIERGEQL